MEWKILNFTLDIVPGLLEVVLRRNGTAKEEIDYFIFHQANKFILNTLRKVCLIPKDKFYLDLDRVGNTVSSTVLIGLKESMDKQVITPGMQVVLAGFGVGLSWGATVLTF